MDATNSRGYRHGISSEASKVSLFAYDILSYIHNPVSSYVRSPREASEADAVSSWDAQLQDPISVLQGSQVTTCKGHTFQP